MGSVAAVAYPSPTKREPTPTPTPFPSKGVISGKIGETLESSDYSLLVDTCEVSKAGYKTSISTPKPGNVIFSCQVTIVSKVAKGVSSNGLYASVRNRDGQEYGVTSTMMLGYKEPTLPGINDLGVGDRAKGWVSYEVPESEVKSMTFWYQGLFSPLQFKVTLY